MNNSITNAMHAVALGFYCYLVTDGILNNEPYYNIWIFLTFLFTFILKLFGIIVHLPKVENNRMRHNFFWIAIAIFIVGMNIVTLIALNAKLLYFSLCIGISGILCILYVRSLFTSTGDYYLVATALAIMNIICAFITTGNLRLAWICLLGCNVLWILLSKNKFLLRYKIHNDIYHIALIASTYFLYTTVSEGLWQG